MAAGGAEEDKVDLRFDSVFDPFNESDVATINSQLAWIGGNITKLVCPIGTAAGTEEASGILYRPSLPYIFRIDFSGTSRDSARFNATPFGINGFVVNLPSVCSPTLSLDVDRTAFGKNVTTINFANGMLTDWNVNKDSELAGLSQIPVDVTAELLKLPQEILTLRYQNASSQDQLVTAQTKLLDDQAKLLKAQQDFTAALAAALGKPSATPSPGSSPTTAPTQNPPPGPETLIAPDQGS